MGKEVIAIIFVCLLAGICLGTLLHYLYGEPKCKHKYEEIANDLFGKKRVVVYMCKSCGKRKVTKVK
jgi:hypothetical protein